MIGFGGGQKQVPIKQIPRESTFSALKSISQH